jgi:hypothetical protein
VALARRMIEEQFMLQLRRAPFPIDRPDLLVAGVACTSCPKRTGNQRELFADAGSDDLCTDPACYATKREAWVAIRLERAKEEGRKVVSGPAAKKLVPYEHSPATPATGYVNLDQMCYDDAKQRTYRQILGKAAAPETVVVDVYGGVQELVPVAVVKKAVPRMIAADDTRASTQQAAKKEKAARKLRRAAADEAIRQLVTKAEGGSVATLLEQLALVHLKSDDRGDRAPESCRPLGQTEGAGA